MDIIHLLPDNVANQIAAGEVIQRPASVIKELVENAIDAGAKHVDVLVEEAGRTSIQIIDDGKGMSETDARLAFERHATSKILKAEDLFSLQTMGFRGEALPSIAAVAQVTLRTRMEDEELGTCLRIEGGKLVSQEVVGCPVGSNFLVQNLFFNVPARRKFLKNNKTELNNIVNEFERMALVNPNVSFTFSNNGTLVTSLPASNTHQRIVGVFGKKLGPQLLNIDVDTTLCRLTGFVGKPETSRKKGAYQYFFVNGRYMRHPYFHHAVQEAFSGLIPEAEQVPYFLYFDIEPANIDVNIHPQKTEIKFENEQAIRQIIVAGIKEALGRFNAVPVIEFDTLDRPADIPVYNPARQNNALRAPEVQVNPNFDPFSSSGDPASVSNTYMDNILESSILGGGISPSSNTPSRTFEPVHSPETSNYSSTSPSTKHIPDFLKSVYPSNGESPEDWELPTLNDTTESQRNESLYSKETLREMEKSSEHYQFRGQYIMTSVKSGLMLVDQHRAHTRILYNRYREQMKGQKCPSQGMLFPEILQLPPSDAVYLDDMCEELSALGFDVTSLGGGSFSVQGVPAGLDGLDPVALISDMVASVREMGKSPQEELQSRIALTLARNAAIPTGQVLTACEMSNLLDDLFATDTPNYTPDGKTVLAILPFENIEKLFK